MNRLPPIQLLVAIFIASAFSRATFAENPVKWNRFHGPNGTGIAHHVDFPNSWTTADYAWRVELPGRGVSSPVIWDVDGKERLFVQGGSNDGASRYLRCIDASNGHTMWETTQSFAKLKTHRRNSLGSSTPTVDASGVYAAFGDGKQYKLTKYDHDGKPIWERDLGPFVCNHGGAFSPILIDDMVVCSLQQPQENNTSVATVLHTFDQTTGEPGWKTTMTAHEKASFSAPCVREISDGTEIVCANTGDGLFAVDPVSGKKKWSLAVFKMRTCSSPVIAGDLVLGTTGSGGGGNYVAAVKPDSKGDVEEVYRVTQQAPYVPTSVYRDGLVFLWSDKGIVTCMDAATGKEIWKKRVAAATGASPIIVGDRLLGVTEGGEAVVLAASRDFKNLGGGPLAEVSQATPAVGADHIYFRSDTHLMALGAAQ